MASELLVHSEHALLVLVLMLATTRASLAEPIPPPPSVVLIRNGVLPPNVEPICHPYLGEKP